MESNYYKTRESVLEYIKLAKDVDGRQLIERLDDLLVPNAYILELGSGPGSDWKILREKYRVLGSDNSPEFLRHLASTYPTADFMELDACTLRTDITFDAIYSNKVLHHLTDAELKLSVKRQSDLLFSGGIICHSFWKGEGEEVYNGLYVLYHTQQSLEAAFDAYFDILVNEDYAEFEKDDSIILLARKRSTAR